MSSFPREIVDPVTKLVGVNACGHVALSGDPECCGECPFYWKATLCNLEICGTERDSLYICSTMPCQGGGTIVNGTVLIFGERCYCVSTAVPYYPQGVTPPPGGQNIPEGGAVVTEPPACDPSTGNCPPLAVWYRLAPCACNPANHQLQNLYVPCDCYTYSVNIGRKCPVWTGPDGGCYRVASLAGFSELPVGGVAIAAPGGCSGADKDGCCDCCPSCDGAKVQLYTANFRSGCADPPGGPGNFCDVSWGAVVKCCCDPAQSVLNGTEYWENTFAQGTQWYRRTHVNRRGDGTGSVIIEYQLVNGFHFGPEETTGQGWDDCTPPYAATEEGGFAAACTVPPNPLGTNYCYSGASTAGCNSSALSATGSDANSSGKFEGSFTLQRARGNCTSPCEEQRKSIWGSANGQGLPPGADGGGEGNGCAGCGGAGF